MKFRALIRYSTALATVSLCAALPSVPAAFGQDQINLEPGAWRITTFTETPFFQEPPATLETTCISADNPDPLDVLVEAPCVVERRTFKNGALHWKSSCTHPASPKPFRGKGRIVGNGKSLRGIMTVRLQVGGNVFAIQYDISGRRAGACAN